ncbi:hypothetical protein AAFF_G00424030 [Aldrovandia affinis]|uniref:Uncharacterized protein n=1 Tax=Aldrovandia affinis TaxID=143900 RepID=A0AAD7X082_9TELE|nr:hypothetical protein AAFF_G00424030 [Aldrovandia affinis]
MRRRRVCGKLANPVAVASIRFHDEWRGLDVTETQRGGCRSQETRGAAASAATVRRGGSSSARSHGRHTGPVPACQGGERGQGETRALALIHPRRAGLPKPPLSPPPRGRLELGGAAPKRSHRSQTAYGGAEDER